MEYLRGEPECADLMWRQELASVADYCQGRGLDPGAGNRTLSPGVVRLDLFADYRPEVCAAATALPFRDNAFDFVVNSHLVEHLPDPRGAIREWLRVVKPGGVVAMVVPDTRYTRGMNTDRTPHLFEWGPRDFAVEVLDFPTEWLDEKPWFKWTWDCAAYEVVHFGEACPSWSFCCVLRKPMSVRFALKPTPVTALWELGRTEWRPTGGPWPPHAINVPESPNEPEGILLVREEIIAHLDERVTWDRRHGGTWFSPHSPSWHLDGGPGPEFTHVVVMPFGEPGTEFRTSTDAPFLTEPGVLYIFDNRVAEHRTPAEVPPQTSLHRMMLHWWVTPTDAYLSELEAA